MSRKILISLGSLSILGAAACALTFFDFNLARTIKEEEEDGDFAFQSQDKPETPKTPSEEPAPTPGITQNIDSEEVEEPEDEPAVVVPQEVEEEEEAELPLGTEEEAEQLATSVNDTVTLDETVSETPKNLKNESLEEEKKITKPEEAPKKSTPPLEPKVPDTEPKVQKPETPPNQATPPSQSSPKSKSSSKTTTPTPSKGSSVREKWSKNRNDKESEAVPGIRSTYLIRDYSFRFVNDCTSGTIWILDYELPKEENTYPTKFFFGTSAQVASQIKFKEGNPYSQTLPTINSKCTTSNSQIVRETDLNYGGPDHYMPELWKTGDKGFINANDSNDVEIWKDYEHEPPYLKYKIKDISLVYVATDFAGNSTGKWGKHNYKSSKYIADFAVIEIDFQDKDVAKKMTRNFHGKYGTTQGINFFAKPLLEERNNEKLYQDNIDIFVAGYSEHGLRGRSVGSFDLGKRQASKLTYSESHEMIKDSSEAEIIGHANSRNSKDPITGYGEDRYPRGLEIVIERDSLEKGSLGSLVTDGNGNAIGVKSRYDKTKQISTITAFRSKEIKHKGKVIIPKYDLIAGVSSNPQGKSYKDSILKADKKTYLSKKQGWGTKK